MTRAPRGRGLRLALVLTRLCERPPSSAHQLKGTRLRPPQSSSLSGGLSVSSPIKFPMCTQLLRNRVISAGQTTKFSQHSIFLGDMMQGRLGNLTPSSNLPLLPFLCSCNITDGNRCVCFSGNEYDTLSRVRRVGGTEGPRARAGGQAS